MKDEQNGSPHWDVDGLIGSAEAEDLHATPRLIRHWIEEGLIDRAKVRGRGRGRGVEYGTWNGNQQALFLALLRKRQRDGVTRNSDLAKIPVWLWLAYGDDFVPTRQVRRALRTWAVPARAPAAQKAEATGRSVVRRLAHPAASRAARQRLREIVTRGQGGERITWEELAAAATPALDPHRQGLPRGPEGAQLTPQRYADHVRAATLGVDAVLADHGGEIVPDGLLEKVRAEYRRTRASYFALWRTFSGDPELGHLHAYPDTSELVDHACVHLVVLLGHHIGRGAWRDRRSKRQPARDSGAPSHRS